jgi:hypothetical protein
MDKATQAAAAFVRPGPQGGGRGGAAAELRGAGLSRALRAARIPRVPPAAAAATLAAAAKRGLGSAQLLIIPAQIAAT